MKKNYDIKYPKEYNYDRSIKRGSKIFRYSSVPNEKNKGQTFVFYKESDLETYFAYAKEGELEGSFTDMRLNVYAAKKDIKIPSNQNILHEYINSTLKSKTNLDQVLSEVSKNKLIRGDKKLKEILGDVKNWKIADIEKALFEELASDPHSSMVRFLRYGLSGKSSEIPKAAKTFLDNLSKKYDAIPDFMDIQWKDMDSPLLILDRSKSMEYQTSITFDELYELNDLIDYSMTMNKGGKK